MPKLPEYNFMTLDPFTGCSGGICIYYKLTIRFRISKVFSSTKNSILWIHLQHHKKSSKDLYICAVYAPQASCHKDKRIDFYDELDGLTSSFRDKPGYCILAGDFNARLGSITGDHASNLNKDAFLDFIHDNFLTNINISKTWGIYLAQYQEWI